MTNLIIGAGPTGLTLSLQLKLLGQPTTLVGPEPKKIDGMALALHPKNLSLLQSFGIDIPHQKIDNISLSLQHEHHIQQRKPLFYTIKYNDLLQALLHQAYHLNIHWVKEHPLSLSPKKLSLQNQTLAFTNLIACDGKDSWVRKHTNISTEKYPYEQFAHIGFMTHRQKQNGAYQHFGKEGTFARLTLPNPYQSAIIYACEEKTTSLKELLIERDLLPKDFLFLEHHQVIPLMAQLATTYQENNIFLAGSALHHIHPLAGIGFNLALGDIRTLAQLICKKSTEQYTHIRKKAHTKAHWLTHMTAYSRHHTSYYPFLDGVLKHTFQLRTIQKKLLQEIDEIC